MAESGNSSTTASTAATGAPAPDKKAEKSVLGTSKWDKYGSGYPHDLSEDQRTVSYASDGSPIANTSFAKNRFLPLSSWGDTGSFFPPLSFFFFKFNLTDSGQVELEGASCGVACPAIVACSAMIAL